MNNIPVCRPSLPEIEDYIGCLRKVWDSRMLSNFATYAKEYEDIVKKYLQTDLVSIVGNADVGLQIGLSAFDLSPGDEVILPSFTFNSTANIVKWNGLKPIFADIDRSDWCIDPKDVVRKITPKTKVIIGTHVFGNPCRIAQLREIADKNGIYLMFDSAHGYGSMHDGKKIGLDGDIEVFSFSGTKVVTSAEGGIVVTKTKDLFDRVQLARNYGFVSDYNSQRLGVNGKISEFNAILGCLTLPKIETEIERRLKIVDIYKTKLKDVGDIEFQFVRLSDRSAYKDFGILTSKRDELSDYLEKAGIQTKKYFKPIHLMDWYNEGMILPVTEEVASKSICLPIYNEITNEEQNYVVSKIIDFYSNK